MKRSTILASGLAAAFLTSFSVSAETVLLDLNKLPYHAAHGAGKASPLAIAADGRPLTVILRIPDG